MVIKRISISKLAIFMACLGVAWGVIATLGHLLFGPHPPAGVDAMVLISLPLIGIFSGFISGALFAALNNLVAKAIGGIEIEVEH